MLEYLLGATAIIGAGYHTMAPRSQLYGRTFVGGDPDSRQLALTFDDGPNDPCTGRLLEVLARHEVRATFFLIGRFVAQRPAIAAAIARAGHVIGNHTYNHPNLIFQTRAGVRREIAECERTLEDAVGTHSRLFRPPYGGRRPAVLRAVRAAGFGPVMWSASGADWSATSAGQIEQKICGQIRGGEVILLHDGGHERMGVDRSCTIQATENIIRRCRDEGYRFVTVPEMMEAAVGGRPSAVG